MNALDRFIKSREKFDSHSASVYAINAPKQKNVSAQHVLAFAKRQQTRFHMFLTKLEGKDWAPEVTQMHQLLLSQRTAFDNLLLRQWLSSRHNEKNFETDGKFVPQFRH